MDGRVIKAWLNIAIIPTNYNYLIFTSLLTANSIPLTEICYTLFMIALFRLMDCDTIMSLHCWPLPSLWWLPAKEQWQWSLTQKHRSRTSHWICVTKFTINPMGSVSSEREISRSKKYGTLNPLYINSVCIVIEQSVVTWIGYGPNLPVAYTGFNRAGRQNGLIP